MHQQACRPQHPEVGYWRRLTYDHLPGWMTTPLILAYLGPGLSLQPWGAHEVVVPELDVV